MSTDQVRFHCLIDELATSDTLIREGFGNLQEIDMANDFYHLPHLLLASGLERLMKCYISLAHADTTGSYPDKNYMRGLGHDLDMLRGRICSDFYGGRSRPLIEREYEFIATNETLLACFRILSQFGKLGRYYNLDIVSGDTSSPINPKDEWQELESRLEDVTPYLPDQAALQRDYYPKVHAQVIATLERFVRAIAMQFTLGDHADMSGNLRRTSGIYTAFRNLRDEDLGKTDYRRSVRILQQQSVSWHKRDEREILTGKYPARVLTREQFAGDWPFRTDRIILQCQENLFCIAYIEGYAFALNGAAQSRFKHPYPHEAGVAILGKSVGPFIDIARSLVCGSDLGGDY